MNNILCQDLEYILTHTESLWEDLRGRRLFITGGTGFFGCWFLESFAWANERLKLGASALVLTRNPRHLTKKAPHLLTNPSIHFHTGDVCTFDFPKGEFSHIIHAAATSALATFEGEDPLAKFDTVVGGTRRVLDFAVHCGAREFLYTSSGAVYGKLPPYMTHVPEEYPVAPDPQDIASVWGESKRSVELLCTYYAYRYGLEVKIARCFSFVGPYLQMDIHYAIGNFIRDGLNGGPIRVHGDGTPHRSYLYAADLAVWLWTILFRGDSCSAYNVGSEEGVSIADLAHVVAESFPMPAEVLIAGVPDMEKPPDRYVPSTRRAREQLGLKTVVDLKEAVRRTIAWHDQHPLL